MTTIVLQVLIEVKDGLEMPDPETVQDNVLMLLTDTGEISGEFWRDNAVKDIKVTLEKII